ncbi:MAG: LEA type 2 family protein [Longimicrobiales bacterium]|nr:LEA type 2 family protein [Longimicrobiales bacterium]
MRSSHSKLGSAAVLAFLLSTGCSLAFQSPTLTVAEVRLASMGLTGGTLSVRLEVANPNRYALESRDFRYALSFADGASPEPSWTTLAEGRLPDGVRVPAGETGTVEVAVPFDLSALGTALGRLLRQGELEYRFSGELLAGTPLGAKRIPFDQRGLFRP